MAKARPRAIPAGPSRQVRPDRTAGRSDRPSGWAIIGLIDGIWRSSAHSGRVSPRGSNGGRPTGGQYL